MTVSSAQTLRSLTGKDPAGYTPHLLHGDRRTYQETNCYSVRDDSCSVRIYLLARQIHKGNAHLQPDAFEFLFLGDFAQADKKVA